MTLDDAFDRFFEAIALGGVPEGRLQSAWQRLHQHLVTNAGVPESQVFLQGSYANDTAIEPARSSGEYDLDVCAVMSDSSMSPSQAFEYLEGILAKDTDYASRLEHSPRCVRLRYADDETGRFHVDVVAARVDASGHTAIPLRDGSWKDTAPREYTEWCLGQGEQFRRTVRMLKRWRDVNQGERRGVKSIVLQVLTAQHLPNVVEDASAIQQTLVNLSGFLGALGDSPPRVTNPVLPQEDLAATWPVSHFQSFRRHVNDAAALATRAIESLDVDESHALWRELLGEDFPPAPTAPAERHRIPPATPAPGFHNAPQQAPERERYGTSA